MLVNHRGSWGKAEVVAPQTKGILDLNNMQDNNHRPHSMSAKLIRYLHFLNQDNYTELDNFVN